MASSFHDYLDSISNRPLLTAQEEKELARKIKEGNKYALNSLIESNLRLVIAVIKRYSVNNDDELMDLVQEGNLGLIKAAKMYNPNFKTRFSTYAYFWIKQRVLRRINNRNLIHIPENIQVAQKKLLKEGHENTKYDAIFKQIIPFDQLFSMNGRDGMKLADMIKDENVNTQRDAENQFDSETLLRCINTLPLRERDILLHYHGFTTGYSMTLAEIGSIYGIGRERTRQILKVAYQRLLEFDEVRTIR